MSKKSADRKKEEEKDLEDEDEELDEEEDEDEPAAAGAKRAHADHDHGDEDEEETDEEDPYWWTPHAVMSVLVLIGVLGFFGVFNKALAGIAAHPAPAATAAADKPATAATPPAPTHAARPPMPTAPPGPRAPPPPVPDDVKAAPATATKTASGLAYRVIKKGSGAQSPKATDEVSVNYTGWTTDGKMFDSSITRGQPASFRLNQVIKGWTEGVQLMHVGDTVRFWIPGDLAYGDTPKRPGAPAGTLVFDVELLAIK
jgi:hypothetical protein